MNSTFLAGVLWYLSATIGGTTISAVLCVQASIKNEWSFITVGTITVVTLFVAHLIARRYRKYP
ncbi:MAG: hypothetical protein WC761_02710 [Candidatus Paceibacterota bacterium]|jgi:hypothetical protein